MAVLNRDNRRGPGIRRNRVGREKGNSDIDNLNAQISENEKRIGILYTEMGEKYFSLHRKDAEEPFRQHIRAIEDMMRQNEQWNDQIQTLRGMVKCPHCGSYVPNNVVYCTVCGGRVIPETSKICPKCGMIVDQETMFCPRCGTRVPDETPNSEKKASASAARVTCRVCGAAVDADSLYCPACGSRIEETAGPESPEAAVSHPESKSEDAEPKPVEVQEERESDAPTEPTDAPTEAPKEQESDVSAKPKPPEVPTEAALLCPSCGFPLEPGDLFCPNCGCDVSKEPKEEEAAPETKGRKCPNCGAEVDEDSIFCMKCGTRL